MTLRATITTVLLAFALLSACAVTYVEEQKGYGRQDTEQKMPAYHGPKTVVAVLPLGLSQRAARRYPQLLSRDVGLGIHNRVVEALYDTNRFRFVEDKPEIVKDVLKRQWMSGAGMVARNTAIEIGHLLGAAKVIYGEVYDFSQGGDRITATSRDTSRRTRVGVQIRLIDTTTLEYIPASGVGYGNDVGEASEIAIRDAVINLVQRLNERTAPSPGAQE